MRQGTPEAPIGRQHPELWEATLDYLTTSIISGRFPPGERLVEETIAENFGVSRGPIRRALTELEHRGLVEIQPRRGAYVVRLQPDDVVELYDLRASLETAAIRIGHSKPNANRRLDELETALEALETAVRSSDPVAHIRADLEFHRMLMEFSESRRLVTAWDVFADQALLAMSIVHKSQPDIWSAESVDRTWSDHRELFDLLKADRPADAEQLLLKHLDRAGAVAAVVLAQGPETKG